MESAVRVGRWAISRGVPAGTLAAQSAVPKGSDRGETGGGERWAISRGETGVGVWWTMSRRRFRRYILAAAWLLAGVMWPQARLSAQTPDEAVAEAWWTAEVEAADLGAWDADDPENAALTLEYLQEWLSHPLNLNTATYDDLEALGLLTPWEIEAVLRFRHNYGVMTGAHELRFIPDFPAEKALRLIPFVSFEPAQTPRSWAQVVKERGRHEFLSRYGRKLSRSKAYTEHKYVGGPDVAALRYRFKADECLQAGLAMEKDAGEKGFPDSWAGFVMLGDSRSGNTGSNSTFGSNRNRNAAQKDRYPTLRAWIIGSYTLSFGYGLHFGGGLFGSGGLAAAEGLARPGAGLRPFASTAESGYLSGSALRVQAARHTELTFFYSHRRVDAGIENGAITTLSESGYHRTPTECQKRQQALQQVAGLAAEQKFGAVKMGAVLSYTFLDKPYLPNVQLYNKFSYLSDKVLGGSVYYRALWRSLHFYGEAGWSCVFREADRAEVAQTQAATTAGPATTTPSAAFFQGLQWKAHRRFSLAAQLRFYPRTYSGFFVHAPGESKGSNEIGLTLAATTRLTGRLSLDLTAKYALHPWFSYPAQPPGLEARYDLRLSYTAYRNALQLYLLCRYEPLDPVVATPNLAPHVGTRPVVSAPKPNPATPNLAPKAATSPEAAATPNPTNSTPTAKNLSLRLHFAYDTPGGLSCRSRAEWHPLSQGYLLYQDLGYKLSSGKLSVKARYALFQTQSTQDRFYVYESDLLYNAGFPSYSGTGQRFYLYLQYKPFRFLTLEARYAHTLYDSQFTSGSGLNESPGFLQPDVKCQIRFKF